MILTRTIYSHAVATRRELGPRQVLRGGFREDQLEYKSRHKVAGVAMKAIRAIAKPLTEYLAEQEIVLILRRVGKTAVAR